MQDYFSMYKDIWNWHKQHIDHIANTDEFWRPYINEMRAIGKKYGNTQFIHDLLFAELNEIERLAKQEEGDSNAE